MGWVERQIDRDIARERRDTLKLVREAERTSASSWWAAFYAAKHALSAALGFLIAGFWILMLALLIYYIVIEL